MFGVLQKCGERTVQVLEQNPALNCIVRAGQARSCIHQHSDRVGLWWWGGVFFTVNFVHFFICPLSINVIQKWGLYLVCKLIHTGLRYFFYYKFAQSGGKVVFHKASSKFCRASTVFIQFS